MNQQRILRKRRCQDSCPFAVVMLGAAAIVFRRMSRWLMRSFQIYTIRSVLSFIFFIYQMKVVGTFSCCLSQICSEPFKGLRGRRGMLRSNSANYYFSLESPYQLWISSLRARQKSKLTCSLLLNRESLGFYLSSSWSMLIALYWSKVVLASSLCQYTAEMLAKYPRQSQYILLESSMTLSSLLFLLCFISSNCSFRVLTWPSICLIIDYLPNSLVDSSSSLILLLSNNSFVFSSSATTKLKLSLAP